MDSNMVEPTDGTDNKIVNRDPPEVDEERKDFIGDWVSKINHAKKFHDKAFKQMRKDMEFAFFGANKEWIENDWYVANLVQRHISQRTSGLYAKNPRIVSRLRDRLWYQIWDGNVSSIQQAMQSLQPPQPGMPPPDPQQMMQQMQQANLLLKDVQQGNQLKQMYAKVGKTLEVLFTYYTDEQVPNFKMMAKQLVRRTLTTGVGYIKLGYQRIMQPRPEIETAVADHTARILHLEALSANIADGETDPNSGEIEELKQAMAAMQADPGVIAREGLIFDYPLSTSIIIDPNCYNLRGFVGADWVVQEFKFTKEKVQEIYQKDIGTNFTAHKPEDAARYQKEGKKTKDLACVWEVYHKGSGLTFTIVEGYDDYLREPEHQEAELEQFYPFFTLTFNDFENEDELFPRSDVRLLQHQQKEHNRARQSLREHRIANRPKFVAAAGRLTETDKEKLKSHPVNALIEIAGLAVGEKMEDLLQPMKLNPLDPALYDVAHVFDDFLKVVGSQEANIGGVSGSSATEASIAESSRMTTQSSNVDDLDEFLSDVAKAAGQILFKMCSPEVVQKIAGPGAAWPQLSKQEIMENVYLEIEAGSSGKPNKAAELTNWNMIMPYLIQIPGISPQWILNELLKRLDDRMDTTDAFSNMPSVVSMNAMAQASAKAPQVQPGTGDPATDPSSQGGDPGVKPASSIAHFGGMNPDQARPAYPAPQ